MRELVITEIKESRYWHKREELDLELPTLSLMSNEELLQLFAKIILLN